MIQASGVRSSTLSAGPVFVKQMAGAPEKAERAPSHDRILAGQALGFTARIVALDTLHDGQGCHVTASRLGLLALLTISRAVGSPRDW